ncbi:MAG TPA: hypothetical protein PKD83_12840 [Ignavibacteria bacterium]|nr:hypothetical protein [Ignavibacteria bacterium]
MNEGEINRKVEETLNSIDNLSRSAPDDYMFMKIEKSLRSKKSSFVLKNTYAGKFAIGFAVLLIINIFSFLNYENNQKHNINTTEFKSSDYSDKINEFAKSNFYDDDEYNYNKK